MLRSAIAVSTSHRLENPPRTRPTRAAPLARPTARVGSEEIRAALAERDGSVERAAADLGLPNRFALYRLMKKLGVTQGGSR